MGTDSFKICAGIVTYNPDISRLKDNYAHIKDQADFVVICDNGSDNVEEISSLLTGGRDSIIKLCEYAKDKGYKWILTLDHDSVCPDDMVERLAKHCADSVSIVGPRILYRGNEKYSAKFTDEIEYPDWVITSGSLTNTDVWKAIGGFDDALFIDKVDTDYGIRANRAGYKIVRDNSVVLDHELGNLKCKRVFCRTIYVTNHSPLRIYYQCRNIYYLSKKIGLKHPFIETMKIKTKIRLYEDNKAEKLKQAKRGIADGRAMAKDIVIEGNR